MGGEGNEGDEVEKKKENEVVYIKGYIHAIHREKKDIEISEKK